MKKSNSISGTSSSATLFWVIASLVAYISVLFFLKKFEYSTSLGYFVAMLPLLPFALFFKNFLQDARRGDELERQVQLESLAVAFPLAWLGVMLLGLFQLVAPLSLDDWSFRHLLPFLFIFYFIGLALARRRYGIEGEKGGEG